jgi:hypothetical protein
MDKFISPVLKASNFTCPQCEVVAHQLWWSAIAGANAYGHSATQMRPDFAMGLCQHCGKITLWHQGEMIYPLESPAPLPLEETPEAALKTFLEARLVFINSPRASGALLRLSLQQLCVSLSLPGKDLNSDIGQLVKKGLPVGIQQALDTIRVIGNNAVHPGVIDIDARREDVLALFGLINLIVERMIVEPKRIDAIYQSLPQSTLDQIGKRDSP